jgi:hypothetical protein
VWQRVLLSRARAHTFEEEGWCEAVSDEAASSKHTCPSPCVLIPESGSCARASGIATRPSVPCSSERAPACASSGREAGPGKEGCPKRSFTSRQAPCALGPGVSCARARVPNPHGGLCRATRATRACAKVLAECPARGAPLRVLKVREAPYFNKKYPSGSGTSRSYPCCRRRSPLSSPRGTGCS